MNLSWFIFILLLLVLLIDPVVGLALLLSALAALLLVGPRSDPRRKFVLSIIGIGFMLTALVEVVVLKGDISRMNTVFKFYFQVWVLWAVASAAVLPGLAARFKTERRPAAADGAGDMELPEGSAWTPEIAAQFAHIRRVRTQGNGWGVPWWWVFGLLLAACFLYPLTAVPMRIKDRFDNSTLRYPRWYRVYEHIRLFR